MFNTMAGMEVLQPALEARSPEQEKKRREFIESRLQRRWNFNKNSPQVARNQLEKYKTTFTKINKRIEGKTLNKEKLAELTISTRAVKASLLEAGLEEIGKLADVFAHIASLPPSDEQGNLPHFKAEMIKALKQKAPSYSYSGYKVYAGFMVDRGLMKSGTKASELGYDVDFIKKTGTALNTADHLILSMVEHENLIHKLGAEIVVVLMGPKANNYLHARRGYELVCTLFTSILTLAWEQQVAMALTIADKIAGCYE